MLPEETQGCIPLFEGQCGGMQQGAHVIQAFKAEPHDQHLSRKGQGTVKGFGQAIGLDQIQGFGVIKAIEAPSGCPSQMQQENHRQEAATHTHHGELQQRRMVDVHNSGIQKKTLKSITEAVGAVTFNI